MVLNLCAHRAFAKSACESDVETLCSGIPLGTDVLRCLAIHKSELSEACQEALTKAKKETQVSDRSQAPFLPLGAVGMIPPQIAVINYGGWIEPTTTASNSQ